jgi:uncharacterized membrane protein
MAWLGLLLGALVGAYAHGFSGLVAGAVIGTVLGGAWRRLLPGSTSVAATSAATPLEGAALRARLQELERRVAALESAVARGIEPHAAMGTASEPSGVASPQLAASPTIAPAATPAEESTPLSPARDPVRKGGLGDTASSPVAQPWASLERTLSAPAPTLARGIWRWFSDGNTMVRVGVVVLFFGVAFLLSYFAEHVTVPIEFQFLAVAAGGFALIGIGIWLKHSRAAYALALVGGGLGVLYLTTFAALQLVPLLAPPAAFALLAAIAALAVGLALRFDAQSLAALAALGGFLAPVLVRTVSEPLPLFGYIAVVNAVVIGVAWFRTWRALDLVGFIGTFVLGAWWGYEYYRPEYFATIEPLLVALFLIYLALPIVHALRGVGDRRLDAALVFGVPVVGFALQAGLVHDTRYGLAWSAAILAAAYALCWSGLRSRREGGLGELAKAHGAIAVVFATLVVPFAVDARWTSAAWAVEGAGVYWVACRYDRVYARAFALGLQLAAGAAFVLGSFGAHAELAFVNRQFLGIALIALSAVAIVRIGDRSGAALPAGERWLLQLVFGWGCLWWLGGGMFEVAQHVAARTEAHAMLAWVGGSVAVAALLAGAIRWPRLAGIAVVLLPAIALALAYDLFHGRTSLTVYGWLLYPLLWALHFALLYRFDASLPPASDAAALRRRARVRQWLDAAHAIGAVLLVGQLAWEAGEWTARGAERGTAWPACAHLAPLALFLLMVRRREREAIWPLRSFPEAYATQAGTLVAAALGIGFLALAVLHPGDARPLPYVPIANPLEITLAVALMAIYLWARGEVRTGKLSLDRWLGAGVFVAVNGAVVRAVHHLLGVPWRLSDVLASKPLQAALTLTWTATALAAMIVATRRALRPLWLTGAALLAAVVIKLFAIDLAALSGLTRVVAFLGVGAMLLVIGYLTPLPPGGGSSASSTKENKQTAKAE